MGDSIEQHMWLLIERMQGEIAGVLREMLGEPPYDQALFDAEQRHRRIVALQREADAEGDANDKHNRWIAQHEDDGWTYGPTFDPAAKTHPNLVPYDQLSPEAKAKIRIFSICAKYGSLIVNVL